MQTFRICTPRRKHKKVFDLRLGKYFLGMTPSTLCIKEENHKLVSPK